MEEELFWYGEYCEYDGIEDCITITPPGWCGGNICIGKDEIDALIAELQQIKEIGD